MAENAWAEQYGRVIRLISHDLRNPLSTVQLNAQLIERAAKSEGREKEQRQAAVIASASRRIDGMIQQLVDAERLGSGGLKLALEPFGLDELLRELLVPGGDLDIARFRLAEAKSPVLLVADRKRIKQALEALLRIAVQEAARDSTVLIDMQSQAEQIRCSISSPRSDGVPAQSASGNGAAELQPGNGIALHLARTIVECHHGRLDRTSSAQYSVIFDIVLPVDQAKSA